jgi:hypothetical protein
VSHLYHLDKSILTLPGTEQRFLCCQTWNSLVVVTVLQPQNRPHRRVFSQLRLEWGFVLPTVLLHDARTIKQIGLGLNYTLFIGKCVYQNIACMPIVKEQINILMCLALNNIYFYRSLFAGTCNKLPMGKESTLWVIKARRDCFLSALLRQEGAITLLSVGFAATRGRNNTAFCRLCCDKRAQ